MIRRIVIWVSIVLWIAIVVGILLFFTEVGGRLMARAFPAGPIASIEFTTLTLKETPNQYLVCPAGLCTAPVDADAPEFAVGTDALRERWRAVVADEPRVTLLDESQDGRQFDYVQRSARWRFPDVITVRFIELGPMRSTLAIYSRAVYGESDLGVNRERIEDWLAKLRG